jgi:hypothetical protein
MVTFSTAGKLAGRPAREPVLNEVTRVACSNRISFDIGGAEVGGGILKIAAHCRPISQNETACAVIAGIEVVQMIRKGASARDHQNEPAWAGLGVRRGINNTY